MKKYWRELLLLLIVLASFVGMMLPEPMRQSLAYHNFADQRPWLGIPNFVNVASNLPFLFVGVIGQIFYRQHRPAEAPWSWTIFFLGVTLVALGSGYYHWSPSSGTLVWDRLPMTIGFMGLLIGLLTEHVSERLEKKLLIPALLLGFASVTYWNYADDLRFYFWIQLIPLLTIPVVLLLFPGRYTHQRYLIYALVFYLLAKYFEAYDAEIYAITQQVVGGHSIKHVSAAVGSYFIYLMLRRRLPR